MGVIDRQVFIGLLSLFTVLAFLLNGATLVVILSVRALRRIPHIFLFNVALADFLASCIVAIQFWLEQWAGIKRHETQYLTRITGVAIMTSILSTLAVAFHRLIIIRLDPFNCKQIITAARCVTVCIAIWLVALAVYLGTYFLNDSLFFFVIQPLLILSAITVCGICYVIIYITMMKSARGINLTSDAYAQRVKKNKHVLCTFALIVCSNFACWVTMCLCQLFRSFLRDVFRNPWFLDMYYTGWWLLNINAIINPFIYWTRLSDFRRLLFSGCCDRHDREGLYTARTPHSRKSEVEEDCDGGGVSMVTMEKPEPLGVKGIQNEYTVET